MRFNRALLIALVLIMPLYAAVPAAAQTPQGATVSGTITNSLSGDPAPNLVVAIESPTFSQTAKTGADGKFVLINFGILDELSNLLVQFVGFLNVAFV